MSVSNPLAISSPTDLKYNPFHILNSCTYLHLYREFLFYFIYMSRDISFPTFNTYIYSMT